MKKKLLRLLSLFGPFLALLLIYFLFALKAPPQFLSLENLQTILTHSVIVGIAALGMTFVIISGGIDLSVGSQIALCSVVVASFLNIFGGADAEYVGLMPSLGAALCGITVCAFCGFLNGTISVKLKIVPFIVTLGMMQIARGTAKWIAKEKMVLTPENAMSNLMNITPSPSWLLFSYGVWMMIALTVLTYVVLRYTVFGRHVLAIGSNEQTAKLCGISVTVKRVVIYSLCGVFTGIAGVLEYSQLSIGSPTEAQGKELDIIAAVVIGGGSLNGGKGSAVGTIVGALIMAVLRNGCSMIDVRNYVQEIIIGAIIIGAVAIDNLKNNFTFFNDQNGEINSMLSES